MANFTGANLRYDNSDEQNRVYDIAAEVSVSDGAAQAVRGISVSKNGNYLGSGWMENMHTENVNSHFDMNNLPASELKAAMGAAIDFAVAVAVAAEAESGIN